MQHTNTARPYAGNLLDGGARRHRGRPANQENTGEWWRGMRRSDRLCQRELGMRIALHYAGRPTPTVRELAKAFPMSRATAYRWRRALMDARGEP